MKDNEWSEKCMNREGEKRENEAERRREKV